MIPNAPVDMFFAGGSSKVPAATFSPSLFASLTILVFGVVAVAVAVAVAVSVPLPLPLAVAVAAAAAVVQ